MYIVGVTVPGRVQAFSSYPGRLHSGDDYYLLGSKLVGGNDGAIDIIPFASWHPYMYA
jgi:hypothetical protein